MTVAKIMYDYFSYDHILLNIYDEQSLIQLFVTVIVGLHYVWLCNRSYFVITEVLDFVSYVT